MPHATFRWGWTRALFAFAVLTSAPIASRDRAAANVLPDPVFLIHVQPRGSQGLCVNTVDYCSEIVRSTTESGQMEFQVYLMGGQIEGEYLSNMTLALTWPSAWTPTWFEVCSGGSLDWCETWGDGGYFEISWPNCPVIGSQYLLPIASLEMQVTGPGRLDFQDPAAVPFWLCPPGGPTQYAPGVDAEAGMVCDYTLQECGDDDDCVPRFDQPPEITLTAPVGGYASDSLLFLMGDGFVCHPSGGAGVSWIETKIREIVPHYSFFLVLTAYATGLPPGTHEGMAWVNGYQSRRCASVTFVVEEAADVPEIPQTLRPTTWGRIKGAFR